MRVQTQARTRTIGFPLVSSPQGLLSSFSSPREGSTQPEPQAPSRGFYETTLRPGLGLGCAHGTVHSGCSAVPCGFAFPSGTGSCQGAVGSQYPPDRSLLRQMTRNGPGFIKQGSRYLSLCLWGCHWHFSPTVKYPSSKYYRYLVQCRPVTSVRQQLPVGGFFRPGSQAKGASTVPTPVRVTHLCCTDRGTVTVNWWSIDRWC